MSFELLVEIIKGWAGPALSGGTLLLGFKIWGSLNRAQGKNTAEHTSLQAQTTENAKSITRIHRRIDGLYEAQQGD